MWNEEDVAARADLIARAWSPEGRYVDPLLEAAGHAGLSEMVDGVQGHYPGARFRRTSAVVVHHDLARFGWELVAADGGTIVTGPHRLLGGFPARTARAPGRFRRAPGA